MKIEEARKEVVAAKEWLERALIRLESSIKEEEKPVTLRIGYETEREEVITIQQSSLCVPQGGTLYMDIDREYAISKREDGPLAGKAFELNDMFNWQLGKDDEGVLCLVPIKKDKEK